MSPDRIAELMAQYLATSGRGLSGRDYDPETQVFHLRRPGDPSQSPLDLGDMATFLHKALYDESPTTALECIAQPSLEAYFAARAPEKIPQWYYDRFTEYRGFASLVRMPGKADAETIVGRPLTADEENLIETWLEDPCWDLIGNGQSRSFDQFQIAYEEAKHKQRVEYSEFKEKLFFGWRRYYGDMMAGLFRAADDTQGGES